MTWTRREFGIAAAATLADYAFNARAKGADAKTLRFIAQSDLTILDPIWTTAYITRNHGYMVFDTLFAPDPLVTSQLRICRERICFVGSVLSYA